MMIRRKIHKIHFAILLLTAVLLFPVAVSAESIDFSLAPPSTVAADGGNAGQVAGGNEVAPRGFSIDLNGPDEEGGIYWLQSEYDNYNWNPVYTGQVNGYDEPIPATDENGNTITYDFYAWVDRNPKIMTDPVSGEPFIALYKDGERVNPFPGTLDAPTRSEDDIRDPSGTDVSSETWIKRWKVHFTLQLESGHDYSLVFLRGIIANNSVTAIVNEDGTGYLKGTLTDEEQEWYNAHKFDEYQYREYKYSTFKASDAPQSKVIDTNVENEYEGLYRSMRFSFTTKLNESLYQLIADASDLHDKAEAGAEAGQYPQEAIDTLAAAIKKAEGVSDDASDNVKEQAAAELKKAIEDFEAQCVVEVQSVSIYHNESDFYVGQKGTAKADVVVTPDKAAHKKVIWGSSDNITIDEKTGKWQIDYGGKCSITATSQRDETKKDTWEFEVPMAQGTLDVNLSRQTQSGDSKTALQEIAEKASGGTPENITILKISTASGISLTSEDIEYIRKTFPDLETLDISNSTVSAIPDNGFEGMDQLRVIELPETVRSIGASAFAGCSSLAELKLPSTVTQVGNEAFKGCNALSAFYIYAPQAPASVQTADKLFGDTDIKSIYVPYGCSQGYTQWKEYFEIVEQDECRLEITVSSPGGLEKAAGTALGGKPDNSVDTLIIKGGVKLNDNDTAYLSEHFLRASTIDFSGVKLDKIKAKTFVEHTALKKVILPAGVGTIGEQAFYGCINLSEIILPDGLDKIGNLAFGGCSSLPEQLVIEETDPPELSDTAFDKSVVKSFLVPGQSVSKYKTELVWKDFYIESQITVSLSKASLIIEEGEKDTLSALVSLKYGTDKSVNWSSSDTEIIYVDSKGRVTGKKAGNADITVTTHQGNVSAVCHVTVRKAASPVITAAGYTYNSNKITWGEVNGASGYELFRASAKNGDYVKLTTLTPETVSYIDSGLLTGKEYYYKVRVYKVIDGTRYTGEYSDIKSAAPKLAVTTAAASRYSYNAVRVSWKVVSGASGYQIYRATSKTGAYKQVKAASSTARSYVNSKLTTGTTYYYKVRAYRTVNGEKVYGDFSTIKSAKPTLSTPVISPVAKYSSGYVKVKWKGISGESGYQVYRATSKNGKYTKVASVKMTTHSYPYAKIKATKGKVYYYKVRAYKLVNGKPVYSSYSSVKYYKLR